EKLREVGVKIEQTDQNKLRVIGNGMSQARYRAVDVTTSVYPGFPTDMQAQYMALMTQAEGDSVITETIFENRFMHAAELMRLGAPLRTASRGGAGHAEARRSDAIICASDLRASASLVLAGLAAE